MQYQDSSGPPSYPSPQWGNSPYPVQGQPVRPLVPLSYEDPLRQLIEVPPTGSFPGWTYNGARHAQDQINGGTDPRKALYEWAEFLTAHRGGSKPEEEEGWSAEWRLMTGARERLDEMEEQARIEAERQAEAKRQAATEAERQHRAAREQARRRALAADDSLLPGWVRDRREAGDPEAVALDAWEAAIGRDREELKPEEAARDELWYHLSDLAPSLSWSEKRPIEEAIATCEAWLKERTAELDAQAEVLDCRREAMAEATRERTPLELATEREYAESRAKLQTAFDAVHGRIAEREAAAAAEKAAADRAAAAEKEQHRKAQLAGTAPLTPHTVLGHAIWCYRQFGLRPFLASDVCARGHDDPDWCPPPGFRIPLLGSSAARELGSVYAGLHGKSHDGAVIERAYSSGHVQRWQVTIDGA